jgi:hypothetical protein
MNATGKKRLGLGCVGAVFGTVLGGLLGAFSGYALAAMITPSRETQAYLTLVIVPAVALLGAVTMAATLAALPRDA